ncbi:MAG: hypothetical protein WCI38_00815 [Chthoniobacterales bacterium]
MVAAAQKKILVMVGVVMLALALPLALAVFGGLRMWQEHRLAQQQIPPELSRALHEAAERAADAVLPAPTLGAGAMIVECAPEAIEKEVQRIVRLADGVGGAASSWNDGKTIRIIANIPSDTENIFRNAVQRGLYDMAIAKGSEHKTVVEVLITPKTSKLPKKPGKGRS